MNKEYWQNNLFNKRINEEFPKKFSLCDLDGIITFFYEDKVRLIIYETKRNYEDCSKTQLTTLNLLRESIDWNKFDEWSGVFLIKGMNDNFNISEIYKIEDKRLKFIKEVTFDYYKRWFYE